MATPKKPATIVQVTTTHDGRVASVLYNDGRVFVRVYPNASYDNAAAEGYWAELIYPDTKVEKQ
jgi:hypothetical protein